MKHPIDRAHRRFHRARVVKNRRRLLWVQYAERHAQTLPDDQRRPYLGRVYGQAAQMVQPCSCFMCGNPRRHFKHKKGSWLLGQTRQEALAQLEWDEGLLE